MHLQPFVREKKRNITQPWINILVLCCVALLAIMGSVSPVSAQTTGACCFADGCEQTTSSECGIADGSFLGGGTDCSLCPSVVNGACCMQDGSCTEIPQTLCQSSGGAFQGENSLCAEASCSVTSLGACCMADGSCSVVSEANCATSDGVYNGDGTECADTSCTHLIFGDDFETGTTVAWSS